jgi:hypothetical protein
LKVFLDHNLSIHLAHALKVLLEPEGDDVVHLADRFPTNIDDRTWMTALGDEGGWVVISGDREIHKNRIEREAWRRSGLVVFFLASGWRRMRHVEKAWRLLRWWSRIEEQASLVSAPAAFEIPVRYSTGRFRLLRG